MYLQDEFIFIGTLYAHTINVGKLLMYMLVRGFTQLAETSYCHVEYSVSLERPFIFNLDVIQCFYGGRDSSVGIATRYWLDGPRIEFRWWVKLSAPVQTGPAAYPASCTMGTGSFPGVKRPGRGADHPPPSKCRGQERVGLYLYSRSGPSWPVMGAPLPLPTFNVSIYKHFHTVFM